MKLIIVAALATIMCGCFIPTGRSIAYEVEGAGRSPAIIYTAPGMGSNTMYQNVELPWRISFQVSSVPENAFCSLMSSIGELTIIVDGRVVAEGTGEIAYYLP